MFWSDWKIPELGRLARASVSPIVSMLVNPEIRNKGDAPVYAPKLGRSCILICCKVSIRVDLSAAGRSL